MGGGGGGVVVGAGGWFVAWGKGAIAGLPGGGGGPGGEPPPPTTHPPTHPPHTPLPPKRVGKHKTKITQTQTGSMRGDTTTGPKPTRALVCVCQLIRWRFDIAQLGISERQMGQMLGNGMTISVLARILPRALYAAGLLPSLPRDRWAENPLRGGGQKHECGVTHSVATVWLDPPHG